MDKFDRLFDFGKWRMEAAHSHAREENFTIVQSEESVKKK